MGESPQLAARRRQVVPVALAALLAVLALPALAPAATTRIVAPVAFVR